MYSVHIFLSWWPSQEVNGEEDKLIINLHWRTTVKFQDKPFNKPFCALQEREKDSSVAICSLPFLSRLQVTKMREKKTKEKRPPTRNKGSCFFISHFHPFSFPRVLLGSNFLLGSVVIVSEHHQVGAQREIKLGHLTPSLAASASSLWRREN